jgi:8-oxo-dGTP pyrophosphatase MutT (NUDIX family)
LTFYANNVLLDSGPKEDAMETFPEYDSGDVRVLITANADPYKETIVIIEPKKMSPLFYKLAGGAIKHGESVREAAARETFEELGIEILPKDFKSLTRLQFPGWHGKEYTINLLGARVTREKLYAHTVHGDDGEIPFVKPISVFQDKWFYHKHKKLIMPSKVPGFIFY